MKQSLLIAAAAMTALSVSAKNIDWQLPALRANEQTEAINAFLRTDVGKKFTYEQVREAMQQPVMQSVSRANSSVTLVHESFDKWTAGTDETPDTENVGAWAQADVDAICENAGWGTFLCYQAGGACYQSYDEVGDDGPGYLATPDVDMTQHQGVFRFKARVKNVNANSTNANIQYFVLNNETSTMFLANAIPMTYGEYVDIEVVGHSNSTKTSIMFFSWGGKVVVDDVTVEDVIYELQTPSGIGLEAESARAVKVWCDPVEGATNYNFTAYSRKNPDVKYNVDSAEPSVIINGDFDPSEDVIVSIVASSATGESYPGVSYGSIDYNGVVEAPVALEATDVTENGFTANWSPSEWAYNYQLTLNRTHTVAEDGEKYYYMNEDFSECPYTMSDNESTVMTQDGQPVLLDDHLNAKGWMSYLAVCAQGILGITNLYEAYGFPGLLVSQPKDFSMGGGKLHISGMGMTSEDDVVLEVGFAEANTTLFGTQYSFLEGSKEFELTPAGAMFDVEIEGGTENGILMIKMVDAAPGGDMAIFVQLDMYSEASVGDTFTSLYDVVTVPGTETSYNVDVEFPEGDSFTYSVVAKYGSNKSESSEVITVNAPSAVSLDRVEAHNAMAQFFTLDGRRVSADNINALQNGTYIMRSVSGSAKVMK